MTLPVDELYHIVSSSLEKTETRVSRWKNPAVTQLKSIVSFTATDFRSPVMHHRFENSVDPSDFDFDFSAGKYGY